VQPSQNSLAYTLVESTYVISYIPKRW